MRSAEPYAGADAAGTALGRVLGLRRLRDLPTVLDEGEVRLDGVLIRRLRWSVGYGPDTSAWLLRPAGVRRSLPGILGMHCHGGVRSVGAEQLVDLGADSSPRAVWLRDAYYSGRAPANELARQGYAVLVHDTFSWASRRFDLSRPTPRLAALLEAQSALWREQGIRPTEDERFDLASALHEDTLAKAAGALGQTFAGAVLYDDLVALSVLATRTRHRSRTPRNVRFLRRGRPQPVARGIGSPDRSLRGELHDGHLRLIGAERAGHAFLAAPRTRSVVADGLA